MNTFVLLSSLLFITSVCNSQVIDIPAGVFFWRELTPQVFNFTDATDEPPSIYYSVSSQPFAGLPTWLSFYQRNSSSSGILYGTPTFTDVGRLDVQVIALNRKRFDSVKVIISLNVIEYTTETEYSIDLFVVNANFDTLLMGSVLTNFSAIMQSVFQSEELLVEDVTHPTFRGESLPLPNIGRQHEGVYVVFGNVVQGYDRAGSEDITNVMESCRQNNVDLSNLPLHYQSTENFIIDWCKMNLTKKASMAVTLDTEPAVDATSVSSSVDDSAERNKAIVVSFLILFAIVIIISFVLVSFCYKQYQAQKRVDKSGKKYTRQDVWKSTQSVVIANAQVELREMSSPPPSAKVHTTHSSSSSSLSSADKEREMMDPPPYQYPHHLTDLPIFPESEITLEPTAASTVL